MRQNTSWKGLRHQSKITNDGRMDFGNTTVLVICVIGVLVLLGLFALNYSHLFQQNVEGRNAAEATALQVARDLGSVVYTASSGRKMALLDQPLGLGNDGKTSAAPIEGFNTLMAKARLGSVFAHKIGNNGIEYMAEQDVVSMAPDIDSFTKAFGDLASQPFKDAKGRTIDFRKNAEDTYIKNLRLRGKDENDYIKGSLQIKLLYARPNLALATNAPIPNNYNAGKSDTEAENNNITVNGTKRYKAYTLYGVTDSSSVYSINSSGGGVVVGSVKNPPPVAFTGTGDVPVILENDPNKYKEWTYTSPSQIASLPPDDLGRALPPAIVQITVSERRHRLEEQGSPQTGAPVTHTATAQVGGPSMIYPGGTLCVGFPAGIPQGVAFRSVISIMNYSQVNDFKASTPSAYANEQGSGLLAGLQLNGWNPNSIGHWFQDVNTSGDPVGPPYGHIGGGTLTLDPKTVPNANMQHEHTWQGRDEHDDPSIALSMLVYHWVKAQSLNVDVTSLFQALALSGSPSPNPAAYTKNNFVEMMKLGDASKPVTKTNFAANTDLLALPAYAEATAGSAGAATGFTLQMGAIPKAIDSMGADKTLMESTNGTGVNLANDVGINDPRFMLNHGNATLTNRNGDPDQRTKASQDNDEIQLAFGDVDHAVVAPPRAINFAVQPPSGSGGQVITAPDGKPLPAIDFQAATLSSAQVAVGGFKDGTPPDGSGDKPWGSYQNALATFGNASGIAVLLPATDKSGFANHPGHLGQGLTTLYPSGTTTASETTLADGTHNYTKYSIATLAANIGYDATYINQQANSLTDQDDKKKIQDAVTKNTAGSTTEILPNLNNITTMNRVTWNGHKANDDQTAFDVKTALTNITTACTNIKSTLDTLLNLPSLATASNAQNASASEKAAYNIKRALNEIKSYVVKDDLPSTQEPRDNIPGLCEIKRRALCVINNASYVAGVIEKIVENQQALTGIGLSETSSKLFKLANLDFFPIPADVVVTEEKIENIAANLTLPTNQDSTTNVANNWLADLPSGATSYVGASSSLKVYKRGAAEPVNVNIGHYRYEHDRWMQAASAQAPPPNAVTTEGARRMFIFGMNPSTGQFFVTSSPNTPYVKTGILNGQYVYQNPAGVKQFVQSANDYLYWLVEARDLNAGNPKAAYFADDSNVTDSQGNSIPIGNDFEKEWCKANTYTGTQLPLPSGGTTNQTSYQVVDTDMSFGGNCQHVAAEFRIGCPILGTQCTARGVQPDLDGKISSSQPGCDTPPPCQS